ncbi:MAG: hypothetical protein ACREQ5_02955 [Candidatus Dormibacteria bacterium]
MAKRDNTLWWIIGSGIALFWYVTRKASAAPGSKASAAPGSTGSMSIPSLLELPSMMLSQAIPAPTTASVAAAGNLWNSLSAAANPGTGYVQFPSGSSSAITFLPIAADAMGNLYTQWAGSVFHITGPDSNGNWTAILAG